MGISLRSRLAVIVGLSFWPAIAHAQQATGTVTGTVTEVGSARPVAGAQVFIPATRQGSQTNDVGTFTIRVTSSTKFERVRFSTLRAGRTVEATIRRVDGRWQATKVEPNAGSHAGETGDDHGGGNDDGAGHR